MPTTPPTRAGSTSGCSGPASTTSPTRRPSGWSARPTSSRAPGRSASPSARRRSGWSAWSRTSSPTGPSSRTARASAAELCTIDDLASPAPHFVANALAAAALARAHGVSQAAVRDGLRAFRPDGHRIATVAEADGVTWIDDSKATNPHAAQSSLQGYDPVVWVAGGLAKGARFDDLVTAVRVAAARRRTPRAGPRGHRRRPFATRARCSGHRRRRRRDWTRQR